jgi:hypothetical protein
LETVQPYDDGAFKRTERSLNFKRGMHAKSGVALRLP